MGQVLPSHAEFELVSRNDVFDLAPAGNVTCWFTAGFIGGGGISGYGPYQLETITGAAGDRIEPSLSVDWIETRVYPLARYVALREGRSVGKGVSDKRSNWGPR